MKATRRGSPWELSCLEPRHLLSTIFFGTPSNLPPTVAMNFTGTIADFVYDDQRHVAYATSTQTITSPNGSVAQGTITLSLFNSIINNSSGSTPTVIVMPQNTIQRFDSSTGQILSSWTVGTADGAMDISPDGTTLYIAESSLPVIHAFSIDAETYTDIAVAHPVASLVVAADGQVIFGYQNDDAIYSYNPVDTTISLLKSTDGQVQLTRDASHQHILAVTGGTPREMWEIQGGAATFITGITSNSTVSSVSISADASEFGYVADGTGFVISSSGNLIGAQPGQAIAFDPVRNTGFVKNLGNIYQFSQPDMETIGYTTDLQVFSIGRLVVSDDDSTLFGLGSTNVAIQNPANILYPTTYLTTDTSELGRVLFVKVNISQSLPLAANSANIGTITLSENGQVIGQADVKTDSTVAMFQLPNSSLGTHNYHEQFTGVANYADSQADVQVDVTRAVTALSIHSDPYGRSLSWNLNLAGDQPQDPTGILEVFEKGRLIVQKDITPDSSGTIGLMFLKPGVHQLHALFQENSAFEGSSADLTVHTKVVPTSVTYTPSAINNWSGTATIHIPAGLAFGLTGTVTLIDRGRVLAQAPASKTSFTVNLADLNPGTHKLTVRYSGNAPLRASKSAAVAFALSPFNRPVGSTVNSKMLIPLL